MSGPKLAAHLAEYDRLREEIDNRTEISGHLVLAEVTVLGAAVSVADKLPDALVGAAAVSCFLWLFWLDHTTQIYKIASYIGRELRTALAAAGADGTLRWENYLRELDESLIAESTQKRKRRMPATSSIGHYTALLFGGFSGIAIIIYVFAFLASPLSNLREHLIGSGTFRIDYLAIARAVGLLATSALWIHAVRTFRTFRMMIDELNKQLGGVAKAATLINETEVGGHAALDTLAPLSRSGVTQNTEPPPLAVQEHAKRE